MMDAIAGLRTAETEIDLERVRIRLTCIGDLSAHIDRDALLSAPAPPEPPYWMHLWPGARALARLVAQRLPAHPEVRVLELGCGLALPALVAARCGAAVVAADWRREPLLFARASAARNTCRLQTLQMDWAAPALTRSFDLCLGADIGYDRAGTAGLCRALASVLRPGGLVWLGDSVNVHEEELPRSLSRNGFAVQVSFLEEKEEGRTVWVRLIEARGLR